MGSIDLDQILSICADYSGTGYYVADLIPSSKLSNARDSFPIPARERVIALVDATVFGSAKNGLAIGASGVYWHNDWTTSTAQTFLNWEEFIQVRIRKKGMYDVELGTGNLFNMSGCSFKKDVLVQLLQGIQSYISGTLAEEDEDEEGPAAVPPASLAPPAPPGSANPIDTILELAVSTEEEGAVDVNTAPFDRLIELPGIGAVGANRIIQDREALGGFQSSEQVGQFLGLKPHQVEKLRRQVVFTPLPNRAKSARTVDY